MSKTQTRKKAGRPAMDATLKKMRVTVSLRPSSDVEWGAFAKKCKVSKGALAEWLVVSPEAKEARALAVKKARLFVPV